MKVMMIVKATPQSEAGQMPTNEALLAMHAFNEELQKAGVLLDLTGLARRAAARAYATAGTSARWSMARLPRPRS